MPYVLIMIGVVMVVTATQNTYAQFGRQLQSDSIGFAKFAAAIGIVGAAGYVEDLRGLSRAFMGLIILSIVLANGKNGLFSNISKAISQGPALITPPADATTQSASASPDDGSVTQGASGNNVPSQQGGLLNWLTTPPSVSFSNPFAGMFGQSGNSGAPSNSATLPF